MCKMNTSTKLEVASNIGWHAERGKLMFEPKNRMNKRANESSLGLFEKAQSNWK